MTVLRQEKIEIVPARQERFDPDEFFQRRDEVNVWDKFLTMIAIEAEPVETVPEIQLVPFTLTDNATDSQIQAELSEGYVFESVSTFCCYLAGMIQAQLGGIDGVLLSSNMNTFYVRTTNGVFVVAIYWPETGQRWCVLASHLNDCTWYAGARVFSAPVAV